MEKKLLIIIFILIYFVSNKTYSQDFKFGVVGNFLFTIGETRTEYLITYSGDIDKSRLFLQEREINNFNSYGISAKIDFTIPFSTGILLIYGERQTYNYQQTNDYFKGTLSVVALEIPFLYSQQLYKIFYFETGLNVGIIRGKYIEKFNLYDLNTRQIEDKIDEYSKYQFIISPTFVLGTRIINHIESQLVFKYSLNSKLEFYDLRWANVKSMRYDINGFNFGIIINYVL